MKLITYNLSNTNTRKPGIATLNFNKNGLITFSKDAVIKLDLKLGHFIEFLQDESRPQDWYIIKSTGDDAFLLRGKDSGQKKEASITINSSFLSIKFWEIAKADPELVSGVCFQVATEPIQHGDLQLFAIITKSAKSKVRK